MLNGGTTASFTEKGVASGEYRYDVIPLNQHGIGAGTSTSILSP
jgi:hypothetical protein